MEFLRLKDVDVGANIGKQLNISFLVIETSVRPQKDNGKFMSIIMADKNAKQEAKIFSIDEKLEREVVSGKAYDATISVKKYRDGYSCIIGGIKESKIPKEEFMHWANDIENYKEQLITLIDSIENDIYQDIVVGLINPHFEKFCTWPAGRSQHHSELGGLLVHTTSLTRVATSIASFYNKVYDANIFNIDLLTAACLLHDLGKLVEYEIDDSIGRAKFSADAALSSHIMESLRFVDSIATSMEIEDLEEVRLLKHCIAAHHGKLEWGSPITPATPEASLLHRIDMIDAEVYVYDREFCELKPGESKTVWSNGGSINCFYKDTSKIKEIKVNI